MAAESKRVMEFADLASEYEKVAPWPSTSKSDDVDEEEIQMFGTDRPMVHSYLNDPTARMVIMSGSLVDENGQGVISLAPLELPYLILKPASLNKSDSGIIIDTLDRDKDSLIRPLVIEDSQWAIGSESETMAALLNSLALKDSL